MERTRGVFVTEEPEDPSQNVISMEDRETDWIIDYIEIVQVAGKPIVVCRH